MRIGRASNREICCEGRKYDNELLLEDAMEDRERGFPLRGSFIHVEGSWRLNIRTYSDVGRLVSLEYGVIGRYLQVFTSIDRA